MNNDTLNDLIDRTTAYLRADPTMAYMVRMEADQSGHEVVEIERETVFGIVTLAEMLSRTSIPESQWEEAVEQAGPLAARWINRQLGIAQEAAA